MEKKSYWKTMEGELTVAFLVILAAFGVIMYGVESGNEPPAVIGLIVIGIAILYSPIRTFIFKRKTEN